MQRESYTTITQFCDDPSFRTWVTTGHDQTGWDEWVKANPDRSRLVTEARYLVLAVGQDQAESQVVETEQALAATWARINEQEGKGKVLGLATWWRVAAAMLIFTIGLTWYVSHRNTGIKPVATVTNPATSRTKRDIELFNNSKTARLINLEDGSTVILQPGGTLIYPGKFAAGKREVHLSGEAFFEISKNRKRPFLVYTNDIVTEVVGTSFRIKAADDQPEVEVFVKTGQVNVRQIHARNNDAGKVVLMPNQSISFLKSQNVFEKPETKDIPKRAIEYLNFDFADAEVGTIFSAIESAYGVTIDYPEETLRNCYLSTSLSDEPLLSKLKIVCESISSTTQFRMEGDRVIVESAGCN